MSPRATGRTATCGKPEAKVRLAQSRKSIEVADLVASESDAVPASASVAAALAVLAGIAASDAACCTALGRRSRSQDHKQALGLLAQIVPGGDAAAVHLDRLLDLKVGAHYGVIHVSAAELKVAMRQARALAHFAAAVLAR